MPAEIRPLLILFSGVLVINVALSIWFYVVYRSQLFSSLVQLWITQFLALVVSGAVKSRTSMAVLLVMVTAVAFLAMSDMLLRIVREKMSSRTRFAVLACSCGVTVFLSLFSDSLAITIYPAIFIVVSPVFYACYRVWKFGRPLTPVKKALIFIFIFASLHLLDFPILSEHSETLVLGFSLSLVQILGMSVLTPLLALEVTMAEAALVQISQQVMQKELEVVQAVQNLLMPKVYQNLSGSIDLAAYFQPATQSGGDWWWYDVLPDGRRRLLVGDVTGHGADSAMITALVTGSYRTQVAVCPNATLSEVLGELHRSVNHACEGRYLMTFNAIEIAPDESSYEWAAAGGPGFFHFSKGGEAEYVVVRSTPLGSPDFNLQTGRRSLAEGDRLVLFSDGVVEFEFHEGLNLGAKRWMNLCRDQLSQPVEPASTASVQQLLKLRRKPHWEDDITFILLDRRTQTLA